MRRFLFFLGLAVGLFVTSGRLMAAITDPSVEWQTIHTPHFEIVFDKRHLSLAKEYAQQAEASYKILRSTFSEFPDKVLIIIKDVTDSANGAAGFLPYPSVILFPVLPDPYSSLDHFGRWSEVLTLHELVHILSFEPKHGFYTPLEYVFGTIVTPTALLPRWHLEGLAVQLESQLTGFGRLRSPSYSAYVRALVESNKLYPESIDRINETSIPTWPFGQRPYFLGGLLWHEMIRQKGDEVVDRLLQRYGRRIPFAINGPVEDIFGKDYQGLLNDMYRKYELKAKKQMEAIETASEFKEQSLKHSGVNQVSPVISPNGQYLAYLAYNPDTLKGELRLMERDKELGFNHDRFKVLRAIEGAISLKWWPDSKSLLFDQMSLTDRYYYYRDLYRYHLDDGETERLTYGLRAHQGDVSPDGRHVVFVRNLSGGNELALLSLKSSKKRTLWRPAEGLRISSPLFLSPDKILFVVRNLKGQEGFLLYDLKTKKKTRVLEDYVSVSQPRWTEQGLLFVDQSSGVANLYLADRQLRNPQAITNTKTKIFDGTIDPPTGGLYYSRLTGKGPKLYNSPRLAKHRLTKVKSLIEVSEAPTQPEVSTEMTIKDYRPWRYMLPRYWIPFVYPVPGGALFQGSTSGSDPLAKHTYLLEGSFDTVTQRPSFGVAYLNTTTSIDFDAIYTHHNEPLTYGSSVVMTSEMASGSASFFVSANNNWRSSVNWMHAQTEVEDIRLRRQGPMLALLYNSQGGGEKDGPTGRDDWWSVLLSHRQFLENKKAHYFGYGESFLSFAMGLSSFLPAKNQFSVQVRGAYAPEMPEGLTSVFGGRTINGNYLATLISSNYLMRGYYAGNFVGRNVINYNLEYSFPLADFYHGSGTTPFFLQRLDGALFFDGIGVDGLYYNQEATAVATDISKQFYSSGLEFRLATTTAYHFPLTMILGLYYGLNEEAGGGFTTFFGIGFGGHGGLGERFNLKTGTH